MSVDIINKVVVHRKECRTCDGYGWIEIACLHAADCCSRREACEDCDGQGEDWDDACDCDECCRAAEDLEDMEKAEARERARADYECREMEEDR